MVFTIAVFSDCGGELSGLGGEIVSPGYPNNYPNNSICVWTINGRGGDRIRLTFTDFALEDSPDCQLDSLEVPSYAFFDLAECWSESSGKSGHSMAAAFHRDCLFLYDDYAYLLPFQTDICYYINGHSSWRLS